MGGRRSCGDSFGLKWRNGGRGRLLCWCGGGLSRWGRGGRCFLCGRTAGGQSVIRGEERGERKKERGEGERRTNGTEDFVELFLGDLEGGELESVAMDEHR